MAALYLGAETLLLCALLWVGAAYSGADWFPLAAAAALCALRALSRRRETGQG